MRLAGESGEGVISSGDILTRAAARGGYWAQTFRTYPAEIKGGPCMYQVRIGVERVLSQGESVDLLVCFNQEAFDLHQHALGRRRASWSATPSGARSPPEYESRAPEVRDGADRQGDRRHRRGKNMVSVGAVCGLIAFNTAPHRGDGAAPLRPQGGVAEANIAALRAGSGTSAATSRARRARGAGEVEEDGSRADVGQPGDRLGAIAAGLSYFAGYPITPA